MSRFEGTHVNENFRDRKRLHKDLKTRRYFDKGIERI